VFNWHKKAPMDILTLELRDVTVFQALVELRAILAEHPGEALRIVGEDETLRVNLSEFLDRQGRNPRSSRQGGGWAIEVAEGARPTPSPQSQVPSPRPVLLLRSAFAPGDRALGRRLLLETLGHLEPRTPWLCLAHQALDLLEDPVALAVLEGIQDRGIPVRVSLASLAQGDLDPGAFAVVPDVEWQTLLARGALNVL
jgi:hypothetical protein